MEDDELFEGTLEDFIATISNGMPPTEVAGVAAVIGTMLALGATTFDSRNVPDMASKDVLLRVTNAPDGKSWTCEIISREPRGTLQ